MTYMYKPTGRPDTQKLTFSTWVYIPTSSVDAQVEDAKTLDKHSGTESIHRRIPIMEFGSSIEPRVGIHFGMELTWEGFLGGEFWSGTLFVPDPFFGSPAEYWISGVGLTPGLFGASKGAGSGQSTGTFVKDQWSQFYISGNAQEGPVPDYDYGDAWKGNCVLYFNSETMGSGASNFYHFPESLGIPIRPAVRYNGFNNRGINDFNVWNFDYGDFPVSPSSFTLQAPNSWTYNGFLTVLADCPRCNLLAGDKCGIGVPGSGTLLINSELFFTNFWPSPANGTMQPTPTPTPGSYPDIRASTGPGSGKYFAFGDIIVYFPKRPGVNYGKPANPSVLYFDGVGGVTFTLTGRWPEKNARQDSAIVPTLNFTASGFKLDSWNHIFFSCDLTTMQITGGNINRTRDTYIPRPDEGGNSSSETYLYPPLMTKPPTCVMIVNGGKPQTGFFDPGNPALNIPPSSWPEALLCTYMDLQPMKMQLDGVVLEASGAGAAQSGQIGFPVIQQEIGRWSATGRNQKIRYAYTHIWFDKYIEPTGKNLAAFFWRSKNPAYNFVVPPPSKKAAVNIFGMPDIWCYRDKDDRIRFENNQGKGGKFTVVGPPATPPEFPGPSPIADYRPGPGQPARVKNPTT